MKKHYIKLCSSIIRHNPGYTVGLFLIAVLSVCIAFLGANLAASAESSLMAFLERCRFPDAIFTTETISRSVVSEIENLSGVDSASPRMILDTQIKVDGELNSVRVFSYDEDSPFTHDVYASVSPAEGETGVFVTRDFAECKNIPAGSRIILLTPAGEKNVTIEKTVMNPETVSCTHDELSCYEDYQFGYIYIRTADFDRLFGTYGYANQIQIYFNPALTADEQKAVMPDIEEIIGTRLVSGQFMQDSKEFASIRDDIGTINVLCTFFPLLVFVIGLGFSFIFISHIIDSQRSRIGLLRALGYSRSDVLRVYLYYTLFINIASIIAGAPAGYALLSFCVGKFAYAEGFKEVIFEYRYLLTALLMLVVIAVGFAACFMSAGKIAKIDPSEAYGGETPESSRIPPFIRSIKTGAFFKLSLASTFRQPRRLIVGSLCICASIICMAVAFEAVKTLSYPIDYVFGTRFKYDFLVRNASEAELSGNILKIDGVSEAEPLSMWMADVEWKDLETGKTKTDSFKLQAVGSSSGLVSINDAEGHSIAPGSGVIIDEMHSKINGISIGDSITVDGRELAATGIAREILYNVFYVSPETAENLGRRVPNAVAVKLSPGADKEKIQDRILEADSEVYFVDYALQKSKIGDAFSATISIMASFAVLAFGIGTAAVINLTVMDFNDLKVKYSSLRALGAFSSKLGVVSLVSNLIRVLLGIVVALPVSYYVDKVLLHFLSNASQQYVLVEYWKTAVISCLIPFVYVLIGTLVSIIKIKNIDFVHCLNATE